VAGVADQDDLQAALVMQARLGMDLGDKGADGIDKEELAGFGGGRHGARHPMC
jgi:hypothetical protein